MATARLKPYDYKVYVTGPFQSGKTTFIHTLDPDAISIERDMKEEYRGEKGTTTTGFDLGRVVWLRREHQHDGLIAPKNEYLRERAEYQDWLTKDIELRGVPGQLHFKFVRDTMRTNTDGVVLTVDSSTMQTFQEHSSCSCLTSFIFPVDYLAISYFRDLSIM